MIITNNVKQIKKMGFLFLLIGIVCTMNVLIIPIGNTDVNVCNILTILTCLVQLFRTNGEIYFYKYKLSIWLLMSVFLLSSLLSFIFIDSAWGKQSIIPSLKYLMVIIPLILSFKDEDLLTYRKYFLKGLLISAHIQVCWEFIQIILWKYLQVSLNELLFGHIYEGYEWTKTLGASFRATGLSWEPANLAIVLIIGMILSNNYLSKVLFTTGLFVSTSRTAIILWFVYIVLILIEKLFRREIVIKRNIKFFRTVPILIISIFVIYNILKNPDFYSYLNVGIDRIVNASEDSSANRHSDYYRYLYDLISNTNIIQILIGYGTSIAGYPYSKLYDFYTEMIGWCPESDLIAIFVGNGVIGFLIYYSILIKGIVFNRKDNKKYILMCLLFAGVFYVFFRSTMIMLIVTFLYIKKNDKDNIKNT